jgi:hypothetical protein
MVATACFHALLVGELRQYREFRHVFQVITALWGTAYLIEAAVRIVIVQETSAGTGLTVTKIMRYAVAAVQVAWNVARR